MEFGVMSLTSAVYCSEVPGPLCFTEAVYKDCRCSLNRTTLLTNVGTTLFFHPTV